MINVEEVEVAEEDEEEDEEEEEEEEVKERRRRRWRWRRSRVRGNWFLTRPSRLSASGVTSSRDVPRRRDFDGAKQRRARAYVTP